MNDVTVPRGQTPIQLFSQTHLDQPPDCFGARRLGLRLPLNPGGDLRLQLNGYAYPLRRGLAGPRAAARSFFEIGY